MIKYLETFFDEKQLPYEHWEMKDNNGLIHFMSNEVVIERISNISVDEQKKIADVIRRIDFINGDVNDYLRHLAGALITA